MEETLTWNKEWKSQKLKQETINKLKILKVELNGRTYNEVIEILIKNWRKTCKKAKS